MWLSVWSKVQSTLWSTYKLYDLHAIFLFQIISFKKYFYVSLDNNFFTVFVEALSSWGHWATAQFAPSLKSGPETSRSPAVGGMVTVYRGPTEGDVTSHDLWAWHDRHFVCITCTTHSVMRGVKERIFAVLLEQNWISWFTKMSTITIIANVSKSFTYNMAAKTSWHRYKTNLRHCHFMYKNQVTDIYLFYRVAQKCCTFFDTPYLWNRSRKKWNGFQPNFPSFWK